MAENSTKLRWSWLALNLVFIAALFTLWMKTRPVETLPVYAEVPDFSLTNQSGQTFSKNDLNGKVWIADFIFTRCAGICPMMSLHMQKLQHDLSGVYAVSFTTDPSYDSPQILSGYAAQHEADPARWFFLTGSKDTLNRIATEFKMNKIDEPMMHSGSFVLVDKKGKVRGFYNSEDTERLKALRHDAKNLLKERVREP